MKKETISTIVLVIAIVAIVALPLIPILMSEREKNIAAGHVIPEFKGWEYVMTTPAHTHIYKRSEKGITVYWSDWHGAFSVVKD